MPVTNDELKEVFLDKYYNAREVIQKYQEQNAPEEYAAREKEYVQESLDKLLLRTRSNSVKSDFNYTFKFLQPYAAKLGINISGLANEMIENMYIWNKAAVEIAYDNLILSSALPEFMKTIGKDPKKYDEQYARIALNSLTQAVENNLRFKPENLQFWINNIVQWTNDPVANERLYSIVKDHEIPVFIHGDDEMTTSIMTGIVQSIEFNGERKHIKRGDFSFNIGTEMIPYSKIALKTGNKEPLVYEAPIGFNDDTPILIGQMVRYEHVSTSFYEGDGLGFLNGDDTKIKVLSGNLKGKTYSRSIVD